MTLRRGFTLVEVLIALLVSSVVAVIAYATFAAGIDTQARVRASQDADAARTAMRAMLGDALRHAVTGDADDPDGMHTTENGRSMVFVTRGIEAPLGASAAWRVTLNVDRAGLTMHAAPRSGHGVSLQVDAPGVAAFDVRYLPVASSEWRDRWSDPTRLPDAVEIRFLDAAGQQSMAPLLARTAPVSGA